MHCFVFSLSCASCELHRAIPVKNCTMQCCTVQPLSARNLAPCNIYRSVQFCAIISQNSPKIGCGKVALCDFGCNISRHFARKVALCDKKRSPHPWILDVSFSNVVSGRGLVWPDAESFGRGHGAVGWPRHPACTTARSGASHRIPWS